MVDSMPTALAPMLARLATAGWHAALIVTGDAQAAGHARVQLPAQPDGYAQGLYAALREMDVAAADVIIVERPPQDAGWMGINDRLRRAAHGSEETLDRIL